MPKNAVSKGSTLTITTPAAGATSGRAIAFGTARIGISNHTQPAGSTEKITVEMNGVWQLAKEAGTAWVAGVTALFYNAANDRLTTTGEGNVPAGYAWADAAAGDVVGQVRLPG